MPLQRSDNLDYWTTAREPWPSLLFILPFLLVYEAGTLLNVDLLSSRNGADLWIRQVGNETGFGTAWLFPLLAPILLLIWQLVARRSWKWSYETLAGMFAESLMFAMLLIVVGQLTAMAFPMQVPPSLSTGSIPRAVPFLGAGIYEEMLFRLMLIPLFFLAFRLVLVPAKVSVVLSVLSSSWLFATAHYVDSPALFAPQEIIEAMATILDRPELWFSFTFRLLAGLLFSILFWVRGFGIAVGCHIFYDMVVGVILAGASES